MLHDGGSRRGDVGFGIAFEHFLQHLLEFVVVLLGDIRQRIDEHKLRHQLRERIAAHHFGVSLMHSLVVVVQVVVVCFGIQLFLHLAHLLEVVEVGRVFHRYAVFRFGKVGENQPTPLLRLRHLVGAHTQQVEVVVHIKAVGVVGVAFEQFLKFHVRCVEVLQLILQNQAHVVQSLLNHIVGGLNLFGRGWDLLQVVFLEVWVFRTLHRVALLLGERSVGRSASSGRCRVACRCRRIVVEREGVFIATTPVVLQLTVAPLLLERRFTRIFRGCVVEVPRFVVVERKGGGRIFAGGRIGALCALICHIFLTGGVFSLLFFLFLQVVDDFLNHLLLLFERHFRQAQKRVLQRHVAGIHRQLVEHIAALFQFTEIGVGFAQERNRLGIAGLGEVVLALREVDAAECELANRLVDAVARAFLRRQLVVCHGVHGVEAREVEVADGVIHLVEVFLVAVVVRHALEGFHLRHDVGALKHCALLDAGVEFGAVGRAARTAGTLECLVGELLFASVLIELTEQEVQTHFLRPLAALDGFGEVWNGLDVFIRFDIEVGKRQVGKRAYAFALDLVDMHMRQHVVGLGGPAHGAIAQRLPNLAFKHQIWLPTEVA